MEARNIKFTMYYSKENLEYMGDRTEIDITYDDKDVYVSVRFYKAGSTESEGIFARVVDRFHNDYMFRYIVYYHMKNEIERHGGVVKYAVMCSDVPIYISCQSVNCEEEICNAVEYTLMQLSKI